MSRYLPCGAIALFILVHALTGFAETVTLDGRGPGRTFEGIGGSARVPARVCWWIIPSRNAANCSTFSSSLTTARRCIT